MTRDDQRTDELIEKARRGDRKAFSELVRAKMKDITNLTYRMTGDEAAAADLAQETFIAAWNGIKTFRGDAAVSTWLYRIATNKTLNYLRKQKLAGRQNVSVDELSEIGTAGEIRPDQMFERNRLKDEILRFMQTLPTQQRIAFDLRFYKQLDFGEIAEATGSALGTVKTNYREAIKKLRIHAEQKGWHQ